MRQFEEAPKVMWRVFEWAYDNGIDVTLRKNYGYGGDEFPVLRFHRNGKNIEQAFYPATDVTGQLEAIWKRIATDLCVEPLNLEKLR